MGEIIALVSGKGGSGKTALSLALGHLAADLGVRTLIVDADVGTHGMTYFFVDRLVEPSGLRAATETPEQGRKLVDVRKGLDFLPSVVSIRARTFEMGATPDVDDLIVSNLRQLSPEYQLILVDCQAGVSGATARVVEASTTALVVTEADPISIWAVNDFVDELRQFFPARIQGVVNKAMEGEQGYYEALVDLTQRVRFVGQLPFDMAVRRAFFRREVPVDLKSPSPFVLSLAGVMSQLSSSLEAASAKLDRWRKEDQLSELEAKLAALLRERDQYRNLLMHQVERFPFERISAVAPVFVIMTIAAPIILAGVLFDWATWLLGAVALASGILSGLFVVGGMQAVQERNRARSESRQELSRFYRELESRIAELEVAIDTTKANLALPDPEMRDRGSVD